MEPKVSFPSPLVSGLKLAFTLEQLEAVLDEWLADFSNQPWLEEVRDRADGDVRVVCNLIEERQSVAWRKHNIGKYSVLFRLVTLFRP